MAESSRWRLAGAWRADDRLVGPVCWTISQGRTIALEPDTRPDIDGVLFPGLVNAHAHLDLAGAAPLPSTGRFTDWLAGVGAVRQDAATVTDGATRQARSLAGRGVVAVGDIDGSMGAATLARRAGGLGGRRIIKKKRTSADGARARLERALALADELGAADVGLSPHAPYSVHVDVLPEIAAAATRRRLPLAMHLSESPEEVRFVQRGDGPFADFLETIAKELPFDRPPGIRPIALAERTGLLGAGCLVVHGNDLDDDDIGILRRHGSSVVYCHGTHRHFERPTYRFGELLAAGVNVALGTDSELSNRGVDLLAEMRRLAADRPDVTPQAILRAGTLGGRLALGIDPQAAFFEVGSTADGLILGPAPQDVDKKTTHELAEWALGGDAEVWLTLHQGRPVRGTVLESGAPSGRLDTSSEQG